jgi:hypothetical protein
MNISVMRTNHSRNSVEAQLGLLNDCFGSGADVRQIGNCSKKFPVGRTTRYTGLFKNVCNHDKELK